MAEKRGKLIICDRCGQSEFLQYIGTDNYDGGWTTIDRFEPAPEGWEYYNDFGRLCPSCNKAATDMMRRFFDYDEEKLPRSMREKTKIVEAE